MRNIFVTCVAVCLTLSLQAQDATSKLNEAESAYASNNLDNARFALQSALSEINIAIGKEILGLLPKKLNDMQFNAKDDNATSGVGYSGMVVTRTYGVSGQKSANIQIMGDSPLLTSINALLALPMIMGSSENGKRVKINGYKSILKKETDANNVVSYNFQIPVNQTLITFDIHGVPEESAAIALANSLPVEEISKMGQ